jgi:hypothetical protein
MKTTTKIIILLLLISFSLAGRKLKRNSSSTGPNKDILKFEIETEKQKHKRNFSETPCELSFDPDRRILSIKTGNLLFILRGGCCL